MRTKLFRIVLWLILAVICLGAAYLAGYGRGHSSSVRDDTKFGLVNYLVLYKLQQQGDTNKLADRLRFMVYGYSDYYDRYFGSETITDKYFLQHLADARVIASQERTQLVSIDSVMQQINDQLRTNSSKIKPFNNSNLEK